MSKSILNPVNVFSGHYSLRRRRRRALRSIIFLSFAFFFLVLPLTLQHSQHSQLCAYDQSIADLPLPKVFIAAMIANSAPLLRNYWIPALLDLVELLGSENVHVSILENESFDESRRLLQELQNILMQKGILHTFRFEEGFRDGYTMKTDGLLQRLLGKEGSNDNWIMTEDGWAPRRINYLAELRNMVLEPLRNSKQKFDKVLFLNDVIFEEDCLTNSANVGGRCNSLVTDESRFICSRMCNGL